MENNFEQYEALLDSAAETAEACLDMEGGAFLLSWASELIQAIAAEGYCRSACLMAQKLCEAVGAEMPQDFSMNAEKTEPLTWLRFFAEALADCVKGVQ